VDREAARPDRQRHAEHGWFGESAAEAQADGAVAGRV